MQCNFVFFSPFSFAKLFALLNHENAAFSSRIIASVDCDYPKQPSEIGFYSASALLEMQIECDSSLLTSAPIRVLCDPVRYINLLVVVVVVVVVVVLSQFSLRYRKADSSQLMVTGWSDGLHCRTFLAHYKRLHYLRACGVAVQDPGQLCKLVFTCRFYQPLVSVIPRDLKDYAMPCNEAGMDVSHPPVQSCHVKLH